MGSGYCGRHYVGRDGVVRTHQTYVTKTYQTIVGEVTVRAAAYYRQGATPPCVYPLREQLGLPEGAYSQGMEEVIALSGTAGVYREALTLLNRLTGANVSVHKAETTTATWGAEAKARAKAESKRPESSRERIAATRPIRGLRRVVATDGVSVQTTERWRDAKVMVSYRIDEKGQKVGRGAYAATLHYQEDYGDLLWWLMERTEASRAETLIWLGDGAPWVWNQKAIAAPDAVGIVDFYHAADHLWTVGRAIHGKAGHERAAQRWSQKWVRTLYNGKLQALLKELARRRPRLGDPPEDCADDDPRKVLVDTQRYFTNNATRMKYKTYRASGYPIGSGVIESACRHVVSLRMKRTSVMAWHEDNAEAMLQLRSLCAGADWDRFWGFDTLWDIIRPKAA